MNRTKIPAWLGVAAGIVAVVWAIVMLKYEAPVEHISLPNDLGVYTSYEYYGGDAYTGIQQAAADTSQNVKTQTEMIRAGFKSLPQLVPDYKPAFGAILLCLGLGMIFHFLNKVQEINAQNIFESRLLKALGSTNAQAEKNEARVSAATASQHTMTPPPPPRRTSLQGDSAAPWVCPVCDRHNNAQVLVCACGKHQPR